MEDLIRLLAVPVFAAAAVHDQRTRLVPAELWAAPAAAGGLALILQPSAFPHMALSVASIGAVTALLHAAGGFGMADVKGLLAVAVLLPVAPSLGPLPLLEGSIPLFPFVVLANSAIAVLAYPALTAVRNALDGRWSLRMATTVTVPAEEFGSYHGWLVDDDGNAAECDSVLVEPGVPFMVPLLAGILVSLTIGDPTGLL